MNSSEIKIKRSDVFPTTLIQYDYSCCFTEKEQELMVKDIDSMIDSGEYQHDNPLYQTKSFLFREDRSEVWKHLKETFFISCKNYLDTVENFCKDQTTLSPIYAKAWGYKSWKSSNQNQDDPAPEHNHIPALLSGIFYLKIPPESSTMGTEFLDPRSQWSASTRNVHSDFIELSWCIFPGWMYHRPCLIDVEEPRYTIAADLYCVPR